MGGFFGVVSHEDCVQDLFYGTDYHSHLGTMRGGMAVAQNGIFNRSIHNLENAYFRTKFEPELQEFHGNVGIGVISDNEAQPMILNSHLGRFGIVTVAKINNIIPLSQQAFGRKGYFTETSGGDIKLGNVFGGPVDVSTSGGDITTGKLEGEGHLKTAGGDIHVGSVNGSLFVNTSGGNIQVETVSKTLDAKTAGGDIIIGDVGGEARVSTSGGDVNVGKVTGKATLSTAGGDIELRGASGRVSARTSGGDVKLQNISGSIDAKTAGGEVEAELIPSDKGGSRLSSSGGDIRLYIDEKSKATIEATIRLDGWSWGSHKSRYVVKSEFPKESYETDEDGGEIHAVYKLNGGGEVIELSTSNSNIEIHKLHR